MNSKRLAPEFTSHAQMLPYISVCTRRTLNICYPAIFFLMCLVPLNGPVPNRKKQPFLQITDLKFPPKQPQIPPQNSRDAINKSPTAECCVKVKTHTSVRKRMHLSHRLIDYFFQTKSGVLNISVLPDWRT